MAEYIRVVEPMECDYHRHLPPSAILSHCLSMMQCDFVRDGCGRGVLQQHHGAVWMISSMRIFQYSNICVGQRFFQTASKLKLVVRTFQAKWY